ncbi:LysR family transcriptional regulator [Rickettsiella grylli]|uniref:LysR substrate-binding domain-containing protein n=1 Tax=Rickettsiella grylli TaxID=59196 RepID=UPI0008FD36DC|nr:LysR substrate-binding domain-containing protein [Rickettsiella grylli]OJA00554.1 LysR family transcriptional regulator [Rickettsiella grylli]
MRITLKQLEVFVAIAKTGNVSHAAKEMYLSQSACSMALAALEGQLKGYIFDRHGKQLFLNERGRVLLPKASSIISQISELKDMMANNKKKALSGQLFIGASKTIGNYLLPKLISELTQSYKNIQINLKIATTKAILSKLFAFNIDIALIEANCFSDKVHTYPWKKDELVIVAAPKYPLSKKKKLTLSDVVDARWLLRKQNSSIRGKLEEKMGGKIRPFLELDDTEALKQATQAGLGISCLSRFVVEDALKNKSLVELKIPFLNLSREFHILIHKEKYQSTIISEFLKKANT